MKLRIIAVTILTLILSPVLKSNHTLFNFKQEIAVHKGLFQQVENILRLDGDIKKIVLDAGHGGHDSGCNGKNSMEKEIALKIVLKLGEKIEANFPDVEVIYTRKTDVFIPLFERIGLANKKNADLFISVHCNWISNAKTKGTETFVMGLHRAAENLNVAKRENESILLEADFDKNYDGYDPNSPIGHIMLSVYQDAYLSQSIKLASAVERNLKNKNYTKSRGVKQAGFAVLRRASMPSVLIETGFLSNKEEENYLASDKGQNEVALGIFDAFKEYARLHEEFKNNSNIVAESKSKNTTDQSSKQITSKVNKLTENSTYEESKLSIAVSQVTENKVIEQSKEKDRSISIEPIYRIQIAALNTENNKAILNDKSIAKIGSLNVIQVNSIYKFQVGDFITIDQARQAKDRLIALGYKSAFLTQVAK